MAEWDAARYHRISEPQVAWGRAVLERLRLSGDERVLDVGCGTGRLTLELVPLARRVVGVDRSPAMLAEAHAQRVGAEPVSRGSVGSSAVPSAPVAYVQADGTALPFGPMFDAVFSNATFHWIPDHERLFRSIHDVLTPGGRLVAQCGGAGNLAQLYGRRRALMEEPPYAPFFDGWMDPWRFEGTRATERRLELAGFGDIEVSLLPAPTHFESPDRYAEFITAVCLRHELAQLPEPLRDAFVSELTEQAGDDVPPYTLDYWRLNISARKRASISARTHVS
jgi:trans-aconitate 2-methyltransferase